MKIKGNYTYGHSSSGLTAVVTLAYLLVNKFLPQIKFIRAWPMERVFLVHTLLFFGIFTAIPHEGKWAAGRHKLIYGAVLILIVIELMPIHLIPLSTHSLAIILKYSLYKYINDHPELTTS